MFEENVNSNIVNCMQCVHFYVTWEKKFPKACKIYDFKTKTLPSAAVYEITGVQCLAFERKAAFSGKAPPKRYG